MQFQSDINTKEKMFQTFNILTTRYSNKIASIMDENPDSYNIIEFEKTGDKFLDELNEIDSKQFKEEYLPELKDELIFNLVSKFGKSNILSEQKKITAIFKGTYLSYKTDEFFTKVANSKKYKAFEAIKYTPRYFKDTMGLCLNDDDTYSAFECLTHIPTPFNDQRFSTNLYWCFTSGGMIDDESNMDNDTFNIQKYDSEAKEYYDVTSRKIFLDAKLGLVFKFKNKPAFLISFFIDEKSNVYIQQIQGFKKGRGHYVLGENWQKKVVDFVKNNFHFANNFFIIDAENVKEYLKNTYPDCYEKEIHDPVFEKAVQPYRQFKTDHPVIINSSLRQGLMKFLDFNFIYHLV